MAHWEDVVCVVNVVMARQLAYVAVMTRQLDPCDRVLASALRSMLQAGMQYVRLMHMIWGFWRAW